MLDSSSRITKIGDALSQLCNVAFLPKHQETTANESISGRSYRMQWKNTEKVIDLFLGKNHCKQSYENDIIRAHKYIDDSDHL